MRYQGEDIKQLIPQREPFIMVDEIEVSDDTHAVTALAVRSGNYFMLPDGTMSETGLIEHIAQSCSALMGCLALGMENPPIGLIGEVKHFECQRRWQAKRCVPPSNSGLLSAMSLLPQVRVASVRN